MFFHDSVIMVSKTCLSDRPGHHSWLWLWLLSQFVSRPKSQTARGWDNNMPRARSRAVPDSRPEQGRDLPPRSGPARRDHSSSVDDSIFVGVHGSSYNSSPSSGGTGRACPETSRSSHLEDAFLEAAATRNLENGPTPPTVRRQDRELGLPRLQNTARHQNPRVGRGLSRALEKQPSRRCLPRGSYDPKRS